MTAEPAPAGREAGRLLVNIAVMLPTIMHSIDITIVAVALPRMQGAFSATQDQIAWVLSSYLVAIALVTPATGWLSARIGRRRLFLLSVAGFTAASVLCGAAGSVTEIVIFRLLQGGFGAGLIPLSQAILLDTYPPREHGRAMAIWGVGVMAGPILGPTLGGYLTEFHSWRWVFYINLPIGIMALLAIFAYVPDSEGRRHRPMDYFGFVTLAIAVGSLQMLLDRGERLDWFASPEIIVLGLLAGFGFYWFVVHSLTTREPFLDTGLFKDRNFTVCLALGFCTHATLYATVALLPPLLQQVLNYPALEAGFLFIPRALGSLLGMFVVARLASRLDLRWMMLAGLLLAAYGLWEMSRFTVDVGRSLIVWSGLIQGVGLGLVFIPVSATAFSTLPRASRTEAAGIYAVVRSLGASLGISVFITLLTRNAQINRANLVEQVSPFNELYRSPNLPESWRLDDLSGLSSLSGVIDRQAAMIAYVDDFLVLTVLTLALIPLILLISKPPRARE